MHVFWLLLAMLLSPELYIPQSIVITKAFISTRPLTRLFKWCDISLSIIVGGLRKLLLSEFRWFFALNKSICYTFISVSEFSELIVVLF